MKKSYLPELKQDFRGQRRLAVKMRLLAPPPRPLVFHFQLPDPARPRAVAPAHVLVGAVGRRVRQALPVLAVLVVVGAVLAGVYCLWTQLPSLPHPQVDVVTKARPRSWGVSESMDAFLQSCQQATLLVGSFLGFMGLVGYLLAVLEFPTLSGVSGYCARAAILGGGSALLSWIGLWL
jgi:hypothetical protein